jgi:hypothetical protein
MIKKNKKRVRKEISLRAQDKLLTLQTVVRQISIDGGNLLKKLLAMSTYQIK